MYAIFNNQSFNNMLTYNIVSFEQLGLDLYFKPYYIAEEVEMFFNTKYNVVMDGVMTLHASNQLLYKGWSYNV